MILPFVFDMSSGSFKMSDAGMQSTFLFGSGSIAGQVHTSAPSSDLEFNSNIADNPVVLSRFPEKSHKKSLSYGVADGG